jgi:hypothetical protein
MSPAKVNFEQCEWNPKTHSASYGGIIDGDCEKEATLCVGKKWHLCSSCAELPEFQRMKKTPLRKQEPPNA